MKEYFLRLYKYNSWSNDRVIECLLRQKVGDGKVLSLMGHILAAQSVWLHRINGLPPSDLELWGKYSIEQLATAAREVGAQWIDFVEKNENFDRELTYTNLAGKSFSNNVEMIMIHVVNHSSYHRGQIAQLLRQLDLEPVGTDFITYDRVLRGN